MGSIFNPETFLELTQRTHLECGIQGDAPTTVTGAVGTNLNLFVWVNEAWRWLQRTRPDWHFMHGTFSFATVAGQITYTPTQAGITAGAVSSWRTDTFRRYLTSAGQASEVRMIWHPYDEFRDTYLISSLRTAQRDPHHFSIDKAFNLTIECPLVGYTITGEYYAAVTGMDEDNDTPSLEVEDRMILVYKAMEFYANDANAPEVLDTARRGLKSILNRLDIRRLDSLA